VIRSDSRLERVLHEGIFAVTAEVVPPRSADPEPVLEQARALVGHADAVNVTDNPTATAHMSAVAGAGLVAQAGLEPVLQVVTRDRNSLGIASVLLGAWALGARNVLCLSGDPVSVGDHPDATTVGDLDAIGLIGLARRLRDEGRLGDRDVVIPPRYFIGVAESPLADPYDPSRLEAKLDAGADFVQTQIVYDVEAFAAWAEGARARGVFERAFVLAGVAPVRSARAARFMNGHLPGVHVPDALVDALEEAGPDAWEVGVRHTVEVVAALKTEPGIAGVHVMGLGHEDAVRRVVAGSGLLPRPVVR
jgi:methylenetetrahydrofolate reductase (NADPH)